MPASPNLVGNRYHRLTVTLKRVERNKHGAVMWECVCDCGSITYVPSGQLRSGHTRSCGCLQKEQAQGLNRIHGLSRSRSLEYKVWSGMLARCYDSGHKSYPRYGGRGITVCDEWKESFEAFLNDMGERPSKDHTLDRWEGDKGYYKENCRWATWEEQANNRANNVLYEVDGVLLSVAQIARKVGMTDNTLRHRLAKMPLEEALRVKPNKE